MIFELDHPAIVSRRKGSPEEAGYALVRTTSRIDVPDYARSDVPVAVIMQHGNGSTTYRKVGERLFKQLDGMPYTALKPGTDMMSSVIGRTTFDFGSFMRQIQNAALDLADDENTLHRNVANLDRPLTRIEQRQRSVSSLLKAFDRAPVMVRQVWLGADADAQAFDWMERFTAFMHNIAVVDGIVHVRSFEPCVTMHMGRNDHSLNFAKLSYMSEHVDDERLVDRRGIPYLGDGGDQTGARYFSLNELDRAAEIAAQLGCGEGRLVRDNTTGATVVDTTALSADFLEEEIYRVAVQSLQVSNDIVNELASVSYASRQDMKRLEERIDEISGPEKGLIALVAPSARLDGNAISDATAALMATLRREGEFFKRETGLALAHLEDSVLFLETRRDAMPISLDHGSPLRFGG